MELQFKKHDKDGKQLIWDISSFNNIQPCPYKYHLSQNLNLVIDSPSENLSKDWGTYWHECQDVYDLSLFESSLSESPPEGGWGEYREAALHKAIKKAYSFRDSLTPDEYEEKPDKARTFNTLVRALVWYDAEYTDNLLIPVALPHDPAKPAIEVRFEVPLEGTDYRLSGRIDKLVWWDGNQYVLDRKTTAQGLGKWYDSTYLTDNQTHAYIYALRHCLGFNIDGFLIDATQVLVGSNKFERKIFDVSNSQIEEWLFDVGHTLREWEYYIEHDVWPRRFASCNLYGGCKFRRACAKPAEHRDSFLKSYYKERGPRSENKISSIT